MNNKAITVSLATVTLLALLALVIPPWLVADDATDFDSELHASAVNKHIERLEHSEAYQRTLAAYRLGKMEAWAAPAIPHLVAMLEECEEFVCEWSWRLDTITATTFDPDTLRIQREASRLLSSALEEGAITRLDGGYKKELLAINEIDVPPSQMTAEHYRLLGSQDRDVGAYALRVSELDLEQTVAAYTDLENLSAEWRSAKERHQGDELGTKAEELVREYETSINLLWGIEGVVKSLCRGHLAEYLAANSIEKETSELTTDDYRRMGARARLASPCQEATTALTRITGRDLGTDVERWRDLTEHTIDIAGRLIDKDHSPMAARRITLYEAIFNPDGSQVFRWRTDEHGRLLNPGTLTDETGRFSIVADRRFWEEGSGAFTLAISQRQPLRDREGIPIAIEVHPDARRVAVGDVVVE